MQCKNSLFIHTFKFAFCLFIIIHTYARGYTCIGQHLKDTVLWGTIMWYDTGKQNIWAKKVFPIRKLGYKIMFLPSSKVENNPCVLEETAQAKFCLMNLFMNGCPLRP